MSNKWLTPKELIYAAGFQCVCCPFERTRMRQEFASQRGVQLLSSFCHPVLDSSLGLFWDFSQRGVDDWLSSYVFLKLASLLTE